jgi:type IV pilus assembly protein PilV
MVSMMKQAEAPRKSGRSRRAGFTLIETMIAMLVLSIGVLGLAATLTSSLAYINSSQYDYIAQQKAAQAVESIFTARDLGEATWSSICNVGSALCTSGIFVNGATSLCDAGPDGIIDTADDYNGTACSVQADAILLPASSGTLNATTASRVPLTNYSFQRTITITAFPNVPNLRTIAVLITYRAGIFRRTYTLTTNISNFS